MSFDEGQYENEAAYEKRDSCNYCGKLGLEWVEIDADTWRLCDEMTGKIHNCQQAKVSADDFEDLTENEE